MEIDYKHEVTVDANSWFIRLYVWMWEAERSDINFCKLFWGYFPLFFLPNLIFYQAVFKPMVFLIKLIVDAFPERKKLTLDEKITAEREERTMREKRAEAREARGPSLPQRFLTMVGAGASVLLMRVSQFWGWVTSNRTLNFIVLRLVVGLGLILSLAVAGVVVYLAVKYLSVTLIIVGIGLGLMLAICFFALLKAMGALAAAQRKAKAGGETVKGGAKGFGHVMVRSFVAVKSNTCPKINLNGYEEKRSPVDAA